jgi:two-component system, response regulator
MKDNDSFEILLVEDNEDDIAIAERVIQKSAIAARLIIATDGQQALDVLRQRLEVGSDKNPALLPDVILLDLGLPVMSGLDLLRRLKVTPALRQIPVVVLTGNADEETVRLCRDLDTNMYLLKPMTVESAMDLAVGVQRRNRALRELGRGAA